MAHRIEPFRDYSEHEVVNLFALNLVTAKYLKADNSTEVDATIADMKNLSNVGGHWESGVVVAVDSGGAALPQGVPDGWSADAGGSAADLRAYLGHAHADAHIGWNDMPTNKLTVSASTVKTQALGITLRQTLAYDENGENLLRYPVKKDELQAVGPGETVPVLTRGLVLLNAGAFQNVPTAAGSDIKLIDGGDAGTGTAKGADQGKFNGDTDDGKVVGTCLAIDATSGKYLCKLSF
ncbi:hypothetical protein CL634_04090 [bacterium]|nr:hypothetical protein [bacterium]